MEPGVSSLLVGKSDDYSSHCPPASSKQGWHLSQSKRDLFLFQTSVMAQRAQQDPANQLVSAYLFRQAAAPC